MNQAENLTVTLNNASNHRTKGLYQQQQQQQQHLFTKHSENTMMEAQQGYEKHLWPRATKKREKRTI